MVSFGKNNNLETKIKNDLFLTVFSLIKKGLVEFTVFKLTLIYRTGKKHFLQDLTLIYPISSKIIIFDVKYFLIHL